MARELLAVGLSHHTAPVEVREQSPDPLANLRHLALLQSHATPFLRKLANNLFQSW